MPKLESNLIQWAIVDVLTDRIEITDSDRWGLEALTIALAATYGPRFMVVML